MILVTGAAGKTGKAVVKALAAKGARVRAFVRNPDHAGSLLALGATEVGFGSFEDARALAQAASGVQAIYHICPNVSRDEFAYARAVAAAARTHGVRRFVYHSVLHPQIEAMPHHWQKMRVEEMLFVAGFDLTVLQPAAYMQNVLGVWEGIVRDGVFRFPYPAETRLSLVDLDDVGEAAAMVLTHEGHGGATYELVGTHGAQPDRNGLCAQRRARPQRERRSGAARGLGSARPRCRHGRARTRHARRHVPLLCGARPGRKSQYAALAARPSADRSRGFSRARARAAGELEHEPEKWIPVFRKTPPKNWRVNRFNLKRLRSRSN